VIICNDVEQGGRVRNLMGEGWDREVLQLICLKWLTRLKQVKLFFSLFLFFAVASLPFRFAQRNNNILNCASFGQNKNIFFFILCYI
jgi:hypothetical protein